MDNVMFTSEGYNLGDYVEKVKGDYYFLGWIDAIFRKRQNGPVRFVIENADGNCMIMNSSQFQHKEVNHG